MSVRRRGTHNVFNAVRLPKLDGMLPLSWLLDNHNRVSLLARLPKLNGILPVSWLL